MLRKPKTAADGHSSDDSKWENGLTDLVGLIELISIFEFHFRLKRQKVHKNIHSSVKTISCILNM